MSLLLGVLRYSLQSHTLLMCSPMNLDKCIRLCDHTLINTFVPSQMFPPPLLESIPSPHLQPMIITDLYYVLMLLSFHSTTHK